MGTPTIKAQQIMTGPGLLRAAPLGTTLPTVAVTGSVFSHSWDPAFFEIGATDEGVTEVHETSTETVDIAESLYPVRTATVAKSGRLEFAMAHLNVKNWLLAMNAAAAAAVTSGTGATQLVTITPPLAGAEVRVILAWESTETKELLIAYQCFNGGTLSISRQKGANKSLLPVSFNFEMPDSTVATVPWRRYLAGATWTQ